MVALALNLPLQAREGLEHTCVPAGTKPTDLWFISAVCRYLYGCMGTILTVISVLRAPFSTMQFSILRRSSASCSTQTKSLSKYYVNLYRRIAQALASSSLKGNKSSTCSRCKSERAPTQMQLRLLE